MHVVFEPHRDSILRKQKKGGRESRGKSDIFLIFFNFSYLLTGLGREFTESQRFWIRGRESEREVSIHGNLFSVPGFWLSVKWWIGLHFFPFLLKFYSL